MHEAYQYFRHKYKDKTLMMNPTKKVELRPAEPRQTEGGEDVLYEKLTLGVQHRGRITSKEATKVLR